MDENSLELKLSVSFTGLAGTRIELVALKNGTALVQRDRALLYKYLYNGDLGSIPRCRRWTFFVHRLKRTKWWKVV